MNVKEAMAALQKLGSAQTRKTWLRHGASEPMFGVKFGDLAKLVKKIGVDHGLATELWATGNADARTLALKVADPAKMTAAELDRWVKTTTWSMHLTYIAQLASETPHAAARASAWSNGPAGWSLIGQMALRDATTPDAWFQARLGEIEKRVKTAPNDQRYPMLMALVAIGGRSSALRAAACAASKRIGKVEIDHGDTACKTPEAIPYLDKMWAHAKAKGYATPAEQERDRVSPRIRC